MGQQQSSAAADTAQLTRQQSIVLSGGAIPDFKTLDALLSYMNSCAIVEDMNVIIGIDATASNKTSGLRSFGRSLHDNSRGHGPYARVIALLQKTLEFDSDHVFPLYMFGSEQAFAAGGVLHIGNYPTVDALLAAYLAAIPAQTLSGPTSFTSLIKEAIAIVKQTQRFHLLIILSDGEIDPNTKREHIQLLGEVANYPLSIVCIGVGDGEFAAMRSFDDDVRGRIDVFNFVHFNEVQKRGRGAADDELMLQTLMEVPDHYLSAQKRLGYTPKYGPIAGKTVAAPPPYA